MRAAWSRAVLAAATLLAVPAPALAQQSVTEILSFLLTNRSIVTNDVAGDVQAAAATRDTISRFLSTELSTLPTGSSSAGFTYRVERGLGGAIVRSSESFGPAFVERSLTVGTLRPAFAVAFQENSFDRIDGRPLGDGTMVATASRLTGDAAPFDVETVSIRLRTRIITLSTNVGVTDRLDVSAALPLIRLNLRGVRVDTLRGTSTEQASARADASGVGDAAIRAKYNVLRSGGSGVALSAEARLPTGDADNLLGAGEASFRPRVIGSIDRGPVSLHGEIGYALGGLSREFGYGGAVAIVATSRLTVTAETLGRRVESAGRIVETVAAHPTLVGVETIRLTGVTDATYRSIIVGSIKWNVASTWLVTASVLRPVTEAGLTSDVTPSVVVEYSFSR